MGGSMAILENSEDPLDAFENPKPCSPSRQHEAEFKKFFISKEYR